MPISQQYFNSLFPDSNLDWKSIYLLSRKIRTSSSSRAFLYKILNNVLYLNKMLFPSGKFSSLLRSFCKLYDETLIHLFSSCKEVISLWIEIKLFFPEYIQLTLLSPHIATFSLVKGNDKSFLIQNMILMVLNLCVYKSRFGGTLILMHSFINSTN